MVVMVGLLKGLVSEMIENGTGIITGQIQVHAEDYLPDKDVYATVGGREGADVEAPACGRDGRPRCPGCHATGLRRRFS